MSQAGAKGIDAGRLTLAATGGFPRLGPFATIRKHSVHRELDTRLEIDLYCQAASPEHPDLAVEVKDWEGKVGANQVTETIARKQLLEKTLPRPALFMLYSEHAFTKGQVKRLSENGILACDATLLPDLDEE